MSKVHILILEDEAIVAMELQESLQEAGFEVVAVVDNGKDAIDAVKYHNVDLALLDINIKGDFDGIETAAEIRKHKHLPFIYTTAYADNFTFDRAKLTQPAAFLTKPYQINNLRKAIDLAMYNFANSQSVAPPDKKLPVIKKEYIDQESILHFNNAVFIKQNYKYIKVPFDSVLFLKADGNYTYIHANQKKYIIKYSLQQVLDTFKTDLFVRVHRSYAVNIDHLTSFSETCICIQEEEIPIGRNFKDVFLSVFKKL